MTIFSSRFQYNFYFTVYFSSCCISIIASCKFIFFNYIICTFSQSKFFSVGIFCLNNKTHCIFIIGRCCSVFFLYIFAYSNSFCIYNGWIDCESICFCTSNIATKTYNCYGSDTGINVFTKFNLIINIFYKIMCSSSCSINICDANST